jgi:hypothetical protein
MSSLILKRAAASRPSGEWKDDDFEVLADGVVVGRIFHAAAAPVGSPWMWTLAFGHHEDRTPTHGYEPTRKAGMATFAKSRRRECGPLTRTEVATFTRSQLVVSRRAVMASRTPRKASSAALIKSMCSASSASPSFRAANVFAEAWTVNTSTSKSNPALPSRRLHGE